MKDLSVLKSFLNQFLVTINEIYQWKKWLGEAIIYWGGRVDSEANVIVCMTQNYIISHLGRKWKQDISEIVTENN